MLAAAVVISAMGVVQHESSYGSTHSRSATQTDVLGSHRHRHGDEGELASLSAIDGTSGVLPMSADSNTLVSVNSDMVATTKTTGQQRALVVVLEADGMPPMARDAWQTASVAAAEEIRIASRGLLTIAIDMFPDVVRVTTPTCDNSSTIASDALAAVRQTTSLEQYRFVMFGLPPRTSSCSWAGLGSRPGHNTWNWGSQSGSVGKGQIAHEWGHNVGLRHLNSTRCVRDGNGVQQLVAVDRNSTNCVLTEYGGPYSVMGNSDATGRTGSALTFFERAQAGWLFDGEETYPASGAHSLHFDGKPALMWVQNAAGEVYALEYVRGKAPEYSWTMYDPISRAWISPATRSHSGLLVHHVRSIQNTGWYESSFARRVDVEATTLDMNPSTSHSLDSALGPGESFVDPAGGLEISVFAVDASKVDFRLSVSQPLRPPAVTAVTASRSATLGEARVSWAAGAFPAPQTFVVDVSRSPDFSSPSLLSTEVSSSSADVTIPGAEYLSTYYVRVTPNSGAGRGATSAISELRWLPPVPARVPDLRVTYEARPGIANVSWGKVDAVSPVTHYEVHVAREDWTTEYVVGINGLSARLSIPNLEFGRKYLVHVKAVNAGGVGVTGSAYVLQWTKPSVPTGPLSFSASAGTTPGQFTATWTALAEWQLVDIYEIDVATTPDFAPGTVVSTVGANGTSVGVVFDAQRGTTYFVRVSGVNMSGKGAASLVRQVRWDAVTATTTAGARSTATTVASAGSRPAVKCVRGARVRTFAGAVCPAKWKRA